MKTFRTATASDAEALSKLINSAYRGEYSKQGWTTEADLLGGQRTSPAAITKLIETPDNQIEILTEDARLVACVHLRKDAPDTLYFGMLTVEPALQARGTGKELLAHVESIALAKGLKKIRITVIHTRHELIAFYQRRGYQPTGNHEEFPMNDPEFGLPKVVEIKLLIFEKALTDVR